jgi:O-antigen/teichoic acid export membrane protein
MNAQHEIEATETVATSQGTDAGNSELKNQLSQNVSMKLAARLFYMLTRFFLPPLTLSYVTLEEYGIWVTCFILIGYLGMSAFGVSNVYVRYVAEYHARRETDKINRLLSTGLTVITALCVLLLAILWFGLPLIIARLNIPGHLHDTAFTLLFVTSAAFALDISLGAFTYVLSGLQRVADQMLVWVVSFCLEAILIVALLLSGYGIYALLWAYVFRSLVATAAYVFFCYRALPGLSLGIRHFDRQMLRLFYGYGAVVQLSGLLGMFLYSIEKLIAGVFIGVRATGLFDVGEKMPVMVSQIPASMNSILLPAFSSLHSLEQRREVARLYLMGSRYLNMIMGGLMGFLAAYSAPVITAWVGYDEKYHTAALILTLVCLPYQMHELTGPASAFHRGVGKPARELVYPVSQLLLVALTITLAFLWMGITVIAICVAVALSMVLSALLYLAYTNRCIGLGLGEYARQVLAPGISPYLVGFALEWLTRPWFVWAGAERWHILPALGACGVVYGLLSTALLYRVMCDWSEREYLRKQLIES